MAGIFGGVIGYGLADLSEGASGGLGPLLGALVGAAIAAGGVGIVAVLVLRAQAEWRRIPPPPSPTATPPQGTGPADETAVASPEG